jgi:hypothetical protein
MNRWMLVSALSLAAAASLVSAGVRAFPNSREWQAPVTDQRPGCGDIYATGGAQDHGITCAHCHTNDKNQQGHIDFSITPSPAWDKVGGQDAYKPGQTYAMTVTMSKAGSASPGDNLGSPGLNNNINGFTLTVEDANGTPQGTLRSDATPGSCPPTAPNVDAMMPNKTTYAYGTCRAISSLSQPQVITQWTFSWKAPAAAGDLVIYYGAVDGDGGKTSFGDDVKVGNKKLKQGP